MKLASTLLLVAGLLLMSGRPVEAQALRLTVSGSPATMTISTIPSAGQGPTAVVDASTSYRVTALLQPQKITASLNAPMPVGVTLTAQFDAPLGAMSNGAVALDATTRDLVTNISNVLNSRNAITYTLSATVAAGVIPLQSRTVLLTLVNYP